MNLTGNSQNITIKWLTRDEGAKRKIRERFGIPDYTTLNGWSPVYLKQEDLPLFEETRNRGFFTVLPVKWWQNGVHFTFKYR